MLANCVTSADRQEISGQVFVQLAWLNINDPFLWFRHVFIYLFDTDELSVWRLSSDVEVL